MNKYVGNIVIGIVLVILPFLGFPIAWKEYLVILIGVVITLSSIFIYREHLLSNPNKRNTSDSARTYIDNE